MEDHTSFVRRRDVLAGSACALALSAAGRAAAQTTTAYWPGPASWQTVPPEAASFDNAKLAAAVDSIMALDSYSVLVLQGGRIVTEQYADSTQPDDTYEIASVAKSVVSVLVGIAIDQGKIKSVEQPAADFIPQWRGTPKGAITIRHLLTMTSGLRFWGLKVRNVEGDQFALNTDVPLAHRPGTHWAYATPMFHLLYHIIERAAGEPFVDFAQRTLIGPIEAKNWTWITNTGQGKDGPVTNYYSARCNARDLGRFGLFALNGGQWKGRQLVSPDYFRASISPSQALNPSYGYLWWENAQPGLNPLGRKPLRYNYGKAPRDTFGAQGFGGQVVIAVPSRSLVVVRQGKLGRPPVTPGGFIEPFVNAMT